MNHKERRKLKKNLGILEHKNKIPRNQRFELMRQNIAEGKQKENQMKEVRRLQNQGKQDEIDNSRIASLATDLMIKENLSYIDALERAKKIIAEKE